MDKDGCNVWNSAMHQQQGGDSAHLSALQVPGVAAGGWSWYKYGGTIANHYNTY